ncbi:porin family protein [Ferrimonas gelatinilytica]|uniref:Outer membrane protein beta-barrel domain-containing protein n=1 Tax=Ferrimonas gelatinilytica TaxID=1255257 RepID=A0ABP9RUR8_9GAMM
MRALLLALSLGLLTMPAAAQWRLERDLGGQWFVGAHLGYAEVETDTGSVNPLVLHALGGYHFNRFFAVEARIGAGLNDKETDEGVRAKIRNYYGLYLRGQVPLSQYVHLYALAGALNMSLERDDQPLQARDSATDFSYAFGLDLLASEHLTVQIEAMRWIDKGDFDVTGVNLGIRYDF